MEHRWLECSLRAPRWMLVARSGCSRRRRERWTVRSETRSLWSQEYNDACEKNARADSLPGLHGAVMRAIRALHLAQGLTPLRLSVVHRSGTMHQVVEDGEAGWVREFRAVVERHRSG